MLNSDKIKAFIETNNLQYFYGIDIFETIDSTNTYLLNQVQNSQISGLACLANQQTHGRGRQGKTWYSPPGANIYCSLLWHFGEVAQDISGLSLAIGVIVKNALKKYGVTTGIQLKWPNDVLYSGRKLAGILLERKGQHVVIGIGINIVLPETADKHWIALSEIYPIEQDRSRLAGLLINELLENINLYQKSGLTHFLPEWRQHDFLLDKKIIVDSKVSGVVTGINDQGELLLVDLYGNQQKFRCGEVSVAS